MGDHDFTQPQRATLAALIRDHIDPRAAEIRLDRTVGGQSNPTFFVRWRGGEVVLRKQPEGELAPSAHAIDREYRLLEALQGSAVPVPAPFLFHADREMLGTPFYLMERVNGRVFPDAALPGLSRADRRAMYLEMARTLAALHQFDWRGAGLEDFGRAMDYYPRQLRRWEKFWSARSAADNPDLDAVLGWIRLQTMPAEDAVITHGDYRFANVMFAPDSPRVVAVLDWELATIGPSASDLAFSMTCYDTAPDENGGLVGLNRAMLGIPDLAEYGRAYWEARGRESRLPLFERVFALFRAAMGAETIALRASRGQGAGDDATAFGQRMARAYARAARRLIADAGAPGASTGYGSSTVRAAPASPPGSPPASAEPMR